MAKTPKQSTPAASLDEKLAKRKLDALVRGIHRIGEGDSVPAEVYLLGIGKAGAGVVAEVLREAPQRLEEDPNFRVTALVIDIGEGDVSEVRSLAESLGSERAQVEIMALEVPPRKELFGTLRRYREFLKLEYPRYYWNPNYEPWVPSNITLPDTGGHIPRALAKAVYGKAFYDDAREMNKAIGRFSDRVDASPGQAAVAVVFGLGGGTGSGMVVDLARHLSNVHFGRRNLVVGVGIAPCEGDADIHRGPHLFPVLNELDCMGDVAKNEGVIAVWGDLYRNPFTGGFLVVPQEHVWQTTKDLAATHKRVDQEIASFLTRNKGVDFWETLRLLNWVGAPPTQHAAARTQYGPRWAHVLSFVDTDGPIAADNNLGARLGLRSSYKAEYIEARCADAAGGKAATALTECFSPLVDANAVASPGAVPGSLQFILPCVAKTDLEVFYKARDLYDTRDWEEKLSDHSWLLDLGVLLCEPAIRFDGMAGECLWGCACWVVVPYDQIRGPAADAEAPSSAAA